MTRSAIGLALATLLASTNAQEQLRIERELRLTGGYVTALTWSPDGSELAVGGMLGDLVIVDPARQREPRTLRRPLEVSGNLDATVGSICWTADGRRLVVATRTSLALLDATDGTVLAARASVVGPVVRVPETSDFVAIGSDGDPQRLDGDTLRTVATIDLPAGSPARLVAVSPTAEQLAVGTGYDCQILVFDLATGQRLRDIPHDPGAVHGLAWPQDAAEPWWLAGRDLHVFEGTRRFVGRTFTSAHDGARVAVCQNDGWKVLGRDGSNTSLGNDHGVLALHPDGASWARGVDGRIDIGRGGAVVRTFEAPVWFQNIHHGQLAGDGQFAFLGGNRGALRGFALADGKAVSVEGMPQPGDLVPYADGPELVWAHGQSVTWWRLDDHGLPECTRSLTFHRSPEEMAGELRQIDRWLTQGYRAPVEVEGQLPSPPPMPGQALPVAGDKTRWIAASLRELRFLEADGSTVVRTVPVPGAVALAVSPDRTRVAIATWENALVVDARTGTVRRGPAGLHGLAWIDERTILGVQFVKDQGWQAVLWPSDAAEVSVRLPLGTAHAMLLDVSRTAHRALIGQTGVARVVSWQ